MIGQLRNNVFTKILWGLMGLYLLNLSVDTADHNPEHIPEDLTINDQESIIEIIVEQILGYENAIIEYDDKDTEEHNKKTNFKTGLAHYDKTGYIIKKYSFETKASKFPDFNAYLTDGFKRFDTPPPQI